MANDYFAFRDDLDLKINRHFPMKPQRDRKLAQPLYWFTQMEAMAINLVTALLQCIGDIHRRYRSIEGTLLAGFALKLQDQFVDLFSLSLGCRAFGSFLLQQRRALPLDLFDVVRSRFHCQLAR